MSKEPKTERREMSRANFYRLCNELQASRTQILEERPRRAILSIAMQERLGCNVPLTALGEGLQAVGIEYAPKVSRVPTDRVAKSRNNVRVLSKAIRLIYKKLEEEIPSDLEELYQAHMKGSTHAENGKAI